MYQISTNLISEKLGAERKNELLQSIKTRRTQDDIIAIILALQKEDTFPTNDMKIHSAFHQLKMEYPDFFQDLLFSCGDIYPFSKELERILLRFQQSGIIGSINPSYKKYTLPDAEKKTVIIQHIGNKFSEPEKAQLKLISDKLAELLSS